MNWDAAGAVAEIVGALAVVISLLYLAVQLRNQNRESRAAAMHEVWSGFRESVSLLGNPDTSVVYAKALANEKLTDAEQMQLLVNIQNMFRVWEEAFMQQRRGRLDPEVWDSMLRQIMFVKGSPPFVYVWELRKEVFGTAFQEFINGLPSYDYDIRKAATSFPNREEA
jgi:hypothetical protein